MQVYYLNCVILPANMLGALRGRLALQETYLHGKPGWLIKQSTAFKM